METKTKQLTDKSGPLLSELYFGLELPFRDKNSITIKIGDILNISFGNVAVKYQHIGVQVYFNIETLQVCVRGGNIKSTAFPVALTGYVNAECEIIKQIKL